MHRILLAGVVSASGLGDVLQYYTGAMLIKKAMPKSELALSIPSINTITIPSLNVIPGLVELSSLSSTFKNIVYGKQAAPLGEGRNALQEFNVVHGSMPSRKLLSNFSHLYYENRGSILYLRPSIIRFRGLSMYDCGIVGGHTIETSAFFDYIITYRCLRAITKGPLLSFPISASEIGLKSRAKSVSLLKKTLEGFDAIFVRGKFSQAILSRLVAESKIGVGLDSGFGVRLLFPEYLKTGASAKIMVGVVPRKDYFTFYHQNGLYPLYLRMLVDLIRLLALKGFEVCLIPHTLRSPDTAGLDDESAIEDLLKTVNGSIRKFVKVARPRTIYDSVKLFSSMSMVVTSRMHAGIIALAYGKPTIFLQPRGDVKVLDVIDTLALDSKTHLVDLFNSSEYNRLVANITYLIDNLTSVSRNIEQKVTDRIHMVELPIRMLKRLVKEVHT